MEALKVPLRSFGSVSKAELTKSFFFPVTLAAGGSAISATGFHTGAVIDAAGEYCQIEVYVPPNFVYVAGTSLLRIRFIPLTAGNNAYNVRADFDYAGPGEAYNNHTGSQVLLTGVDTQNLIYTEYVTTIPAAYAPGDLIGLRLTYQAAGGGGVATNLFIMGATLMWV